PDVIFHAAAHKHVPLMETDPEESVKNNIAGTYNMAFLANKYKTDRFVLISTDKAVNPTNVMGATKRFCEMIVQHFSELSKNTKYACVRFGNVLGSNGSVIPLFEKQIKENKEVTLTDPEITRFFMTISEAVSLVMTAGALSAGGEVFVLDMGTPMKIMDLATNLIRLHGYVPEKDVKIKIIGLRPGEKLYEEVLMNSETLKKTCHGKIFVEENISMPEDFEKEYSALIRAAFSNDSESTVEELKKAVTTFNHNPGKTGGGNKIWK
ncbi:MAG: polysaccharide biosynthesis protein, partial [Clostridia bacterium]|nr:polysaccharide biosynthesis protein [Clostridia bacterium]